MHNLPWLKRGGVALMRGGVLPPESPLMHIFSALMHNLPWLKRGGVALMQSGVLPPESPLKSNLCTLEQNLPRLNADKQAIKAANAQPLVEGRAGHVFSCMQNAWP